MRIVYLHGFLSSPKSYKAEITKNWLNEHYSDITYICPALSSYPASALRQLDELFSKADAPTYVIGSSLGGFWATYCVERGYAEKAVLVNPAVAPHLRFRDYIGQTLKSYYSDDTFTLTNNDMRILAKCAPETLKKPSLYWVMLQEGDQVLDYRQALNRYPNAKHLIEAGGNHSFDGFQRYLPDIMNFFQ